MSFRTIRLDQSAFGRRNALVVRAKDTQQTMRVIALSVGTLPYCAADALAVRPQHRR